MIFNKTCERSYQDQDGNTFLGVEIGNQCWMDRNLAVTKYPNGVSIPHVTDNTEWSALGNNDTDDAYCYYENTVNLEYGALYTYAAAIAKNWANDKNEGQGICPDGWHLPTDAEWTTLTEYLGGPAEAGKKLKEEGTEHWKTPNTGATNESGFTALPGGSHGNANFYFINETGYWWTATPTDSYVWARYLLYNSGETFKDPFEKSSGFSVRCIRNSN